SQPSGEYHDVPPPITGNFMPPKLDLVFYTAPIAVKTAHSTFTVQLRPAKPAQGISHVTRPMAPIIEDWVSDLEDESEPNDPQILTKSKPVSVTAARSVSAVVPKIMATKPRHARSLNTKSNSINRRYKTRSQSSKTSNSFLKVTAAQAQVVSAAKGKKGKWVWRPKHHILDYDSSASKLLKRLDHNDALRRSKSLNGGYVAFGGNPKGGKISGKGKIKIDSKLPDENQVLLRVPRENNMYNVNLKDIVPSGDLTCLFAKATIDESNLWHRRLGHNRVLVTKPQNKTPYELLHGRTPSIGFMRPFGCLVTILNTLDSLGKFEGKVDEGFLVGYSVNSKAFRVFNSRTRIVQETLHVNFLENKPNVAGKTREEANQQCMLFLVWSTSSTNPHNKVGDATFDGKEHDAEKPESTVNLSLSSSALSGKQDDMTKKKDKGKSLVDYFTGNREFNADFVDYSKDSSNDVSAAGPIVPTAGQNYSNNTNSISDAGSSNTNTSPTHGKSSLQDASQPPDMLESEDIVYSNHENVSAEADFNNLEISITEPKRVHQALKDPSWIESMQEELLQFKMQKVWILVDLPHGKRAIVARIEAIRLFLAYASFMGFMVYQMDVKSIFLYGTIEEEVYVCQPPGFEDPDHPDKVYKVVKALYGLHQAPRAWYKTLATYLLENGFYRGKIDQILFIKKQKGDILFVKQKEDGIFINQDKYVAEILKKFGLTEGKSASTPIDIEKSLLKDPDGEDVDVHIYRSMIGSLMYLTSSRSDIMFANTVAVKQSNDVTRLQALVDKKKVVVTEATIKDALHLDDAEGVDCLPNEENFTTLTRMGYEKPSTKLTFYKAFFSSQWKFLIHTILQSMSAKRTSWNEFSLTMASAVICLSIAQSPPPQPQSPSPAQTQGVDFPMSLLQEALNTCAALTRRVEHLEHDKVAQNLEITKLKTRVKELERANKGRMIDKSDKDEGAKLMNEKEEKETEEVRVNHDDAQIKGRQADIYYIDMDHATKVLSMQEDEPEIQEAVEVVTTAKLIIEVVAAVSEIVSAAAVVQADVPAALTETVNAAAAPVKVVVPFTRRRRGVVIKDPKEESSAKTPTETKSKDKGKAIMVEEPKPMKKKQQVELDEAYTRKLQEELNQDIDWEVAMDHVKQKAKENPYVQRYQVMKKRPQTEAQARRNMMVYLKSTAGFTLDYFKGMSYNDIRPIFKAKFNANMEFLLKSKEHMEEEESRAIAIINETSAQKAAKKRRLNKEAEDVEELKQHLEIVSDEDDDVYTEATPLARKVPVVDYQIIYVNNKPRCNIIRVDDTYQLYASFITMLKNFDRDELETLWSIVKEKFSTSKPNNFSDEYLLSTLKTMFGRPDG
nr:hypothetical protein [Tanacetum cinerariifolium]